MNVPTVDDLALIPRRRLWTYKEFERAGELGLFGPDERLELIEGEIIRKVAPQLTPHAVASGLVEHALAGICPQHCHVRNQKPLKIGAKSGPEPDIAVVRGSLRDYLSSHPTSAELIVEVADSSLRLDRGAKASLYARAGVPEYWILDLTNRVLEVSREPAAMTEQPLRHHYRSIIRLTENDHVTAIIAPETSISVAELLP